MVFVPAFARSLAAVDTLVPMLPTVSLAVLANLPPTLDTPEISPIVTAERTFERIHCCSKALFSSVQPSWPILEKSSAPDVAVATPIAPIDAMPKRASVLFTASETRWAFCAVSLSAFTALPASAKQPNISPNTPNIAMPAPIISPRPTEIEASNTLATTATPHPMPGIQVPIALIIPKPI